MVSCFVFKEIMKLIQVCSIFYPAPFFGTELTVYKIALKAVEKGMQSVVITTNLENLAPIRKFNGRVEEYHNGIRIRRCRAYRFPKVYPIIVPELFKVLKEEIQNYKGEVIIHSHSYLSLLSFFVAFMRKFNNKVILIHQPHYHPFPGGTWKGHLLRKLCDKTIGNFILKNDDGIVIMSDTERKAIESNNHTYSKFSLIPHGVDSPLNTKDADISLFKKQYNIKSNDTILLCVSRIGGQIVDFFTKLLINLPLRIKVLVVGSLWGNADGKLIISEIEKANLKERLILTGYLRRNDLALAYLSADIFVKPAYFFEAFGIVFMEAMSYGLPVITHNIGALPEIVSNEKNGCLIEHSEADIPEFKNKIESLLESKIKYNQISDNNREKAKSYLWDNILEKYFELYKELINEK